MKTIEELRRLVGPERWGSLTKRCGGTRLCVPRTYKDDHPLVQLLGRDVTARLIRRFGGMKISIPKGRNKARDEARKKRDDMIRRDWMAGLSKAKIARKYGLHERTVHRICWTRLSHTGKCNS